MWIHALWLKRTVSQQTARANSNPLCGFLRPSGVESSASVVSVLPNQKFLQIQQPVLLLMGVFLFFFFILWQVWEITVIFEGLRALRDLVTPAVQT
jgi:hypothetical protein